MRFKFICLAFILATVYTKLVEGVSLTSSEAPKPSNKLDIDSRELFLEEIIRYRAQAFPDGARRRRRFRGQHSRKDVKKNHSAFPPLFPLLGNLTSGITKPHKKPKKLPSCYRSGKRVTLTQYWIPRENEWDETTKGKRIFLGGEIKRPLLDRHKNVLAMVPLVMYDRCNMEGFCLLENGDLINLDNTTDAFIKVGSYGRVNNVFGLGSGEQNLVPFVSIAANDLPYGQTVYIPQLDGVHLGESQRHNGCVRVDDDSWSFDSCQIDLFVNTYVDYLWLNIGDRASVEVVDCKVKNYVTKSHLSAVRASMNTKIIPSLLEAKFTEQLNVS
ncbi:hypothetical protein G6F56_010935 [Rhizopus delemar]|uniref:3D domain-containing protein n=1 Tax=Rhizopus stolonifer TaxID=4846 RepID=A0A367KBM6_RHIST|nr:hypothetical protein G6F56_010935 [Rhizopus delemar]RCH99576.1 hypothetical protein CU098_011307 [Rhizopus stolonifer]